MGSGLGTFSNYPSGFSGGLNVSGMPIWNMFSTSAGPSNHSTSGVYWVSSTTGADGNPGQYMQPMATLARALAVAAPYDYIMLMPGHAETITTAALSISTANITIIGLGTGPQRPTFTIATANTNTIAVSAANVKIMNCIFVANFLAIASLFTLTTAVGFTLVGNQFRDGTSVNFVKLVTTGATSNTADDLTLIGNEWFGVGTTAATTAISMVGTNARLKVRGNYFETKSTAQGAVMLIATTKLVTNMIMDNNVFNLVGSTSALGILITTDGTTNSGTINNNYIHSLDTSAPILVTALSGFIFDQNYYASAADLSGALLPAVS